MFLPSASSVPLTDNQYWGHSEGCTATFLVQFVAAMTPSAFLRHFTCFHTLTLRLLKHVVSSIRESFSSFPILTFGRLLACWCPKCSRAFRQADWWGLFREKRCGGQWTEGVKWWNGQRGRRQWALMDFSNLRGISCCLKFCGDRWWNKPCIRISQHYTEHWYLHNQILSDKEFLLFRLTELKQQCFFFLSLLNNVFLLLYFYVSFSILLPKIALLRLIINSAGLEQNNIPCVTYLETGFVLTALVSKIKTRLATAS